MTAFHCAWLTSYFPIRKGLNKTSWTGSSSSQDSGSKFCPFGSVRCAPIQNVPPGRRTITIPVWRCRYSRYPCAFMPSGSKRYQKRMCGQESQAARARTRMPTEAVRSAMRLPWDFDRIFDPAS